MKLILCFFKQLFGFGKAKEVEDDYRGIFECEVGRQPFKYLVIPIYYRKLLNKKWKPVEDGLYCSLTGLPMFILPF
jgi:hypothetical protein